MQQDAVEHLKITTLKIQLHVHIHTKTLKKNNPKQTQQQAFCFCASFFLQKLQKESMVR